MDNTDADLNCILNHKRELFDYFVRLRRQCADGFLRCADTDLFFAQRAAECSFDDLFRSDWERLIELSPRVDLPRRIPSFSVLLCVPGMMDTMKVPNPAAVFSAARLSRDIDLDSIAPPKKENRGMVNPYKKPNTAS